MMRRCQAVIIADFPPRMRGALPCGPASAASALEPPEVVMRASAASGAARCGGVMRADAASALEPLRGRRCFRRYPVRRRYRGEHLFSEIQFHANPHEAAQRGAICYH